MVEAQAAASANVGQGPQTGTTKPKKRAVVLIHGIGGQTPMETLRPFVEAVWTEAPRPGDEPKHLTWSQRDLKSDNLELWRITTTKDAEGIRTDFFEFYWADMMEDTKLSSVTSWIKHLFWRSPRRVPTSVFAPWIAGWIVLFTFAAIFGVAFVLGQQKFAGLGGAISGLVVAAAYAWFGFLKDGILIAVVGDAARYLTPAPANIAARTRIRLAGLKLLQSLHCDDAYDRIIIVSHSLGTVVGYDLLNFFWSDINDQIHHDRSKSKALAAIERAGRDVRLDPKGKVAEFCDAQRAYFREVRRLVPDKWKISDFVTLGSPLTHAHLLMVDDRQKPLQSEQHAIAAKWLEPWWARLDQKTKDIAAMFRARAAQRELPLCPPLTESGDEFVYRRDAGSNLVTPHHAAVFAAVRWTNIFAPCQLVFKGDVVGGPVAPLFGPGVKDIALTGEVGKMTLAHTHYWDEVRKDSEHLEALRSALNFLDQEEPAAWAGYDAERRRLSGRA